MPSATRHDSAHGSAQNTAHDSKYETEHHENHSAHDPERFRRKFWWGLALTVPILVFSPGL